MFARESGRSSACASVITVCFVSRICAAGVGRELRPRPALSGVSLRPALLAELRLLLARHLGGQVGVTGEVGVALDRVRLAADRVLEDRRLELSSVGTLPPVAFATANCTASRTLSLPVATVIILNGLSAWLSCPEAAQRVAVGRGQRRDGAGRSRGTAAAS